MTKPTTSIEQIATSCIAGRMRLLNRVVTNLYDDALRPIGIRLSQGNVLAVTAKLGVARPAEVCDILELDTSTLSRTVDRMVENGWLEIVPDEDGRSQPFRLTDQGRRLMEKSVPAWEKAQAEANEAAGRGWSSTTGCGHQAGEVRSGQVVSLFLSHILAYANIWRTDADRHAHRSEGRITARPSSMPPACGNWPSIAGPTTPGWSRSAIRRWTTSGPTS